jgi:peptidyl-prolyl cis-trans isomerase SurA
VPAVVSLLAWSVTFLAGCHREALSAPDAASTDGGAVSAPSAPAPDGSVAAPTRTVTKLPPIGKQIDLLQILISHKDVHVPWVPNRAKKRTPAEAEKIARRVVQDARHGADFDKLAKEWSDWPFAAQNGGKLGILVEGTGNMPELTTEGMKLEVGGVSDVVPTSLGYAVLKRVPLVRISHVVIGYAGLPGGRATRTREEAERLAASVHDDIVSGKISFADAAFEYSDELVSAGRGGDIGSFETKNPQLPQTLKAAMALRKGEISAPFDSPLGFEILQRTE